MSQVVIENPVINSPFDEPTRHFRFGDEGITDEIVDGRRTSSYFVPIARPRKKGGQLAFDTEWIQERVQENELINDIRNDAHFYCALNYMHYNPVKHGYASDSYEWPWSSLTNYLDARGREWLRDAWKAYRPGDDFGKGWDD